MNRSLKLPLLIALALASTPLLAVDLGQIQVKSALGQPLLAEIPVHAATPAELQHLTAQLASNDEFARAGIAGGRTTIPLHFSVADAAGGQPVIRITSATPVEDPFLDLLIEVNAQSGKSVREFAILLDPPGAAAPAAMAAAPAVPRTQPAPVAPSPAPAAIQPQPQSPVGAVERTPPHTVAAATSPAPAAGGQYGPVVRGDTLSAIARTATPAGVDVHQMLLAIKQANPDAFYRDNINALKAGAILRLPTATEAQTMAVVAAIAEVRRQNGDWNAKAAVSPAVVADTATRASASSAPTPVAADTNDRLALVPAMEGADAAGTGAGGSAGSKGTASASTLRQNLLRAQESLATVQQQSADLKTQVKDLTDINDKNVRLLSLKDSEIADLQAKLAAARQGVATAPAETVSATASATKDAASVAAAGSAAAPAPVAASSAASPAASGTAGVAGLAAGAVASTAAVSTPAPVAAASAPTATTPDATSAAGNQVTSAPWYMQKWAWAAGAGAVVLLLLLALLGRRRKPLADAAGGSSLADRFVATPTTGALATDDAEQDELLDQLAERPDDIGLHLELVTLYYSRRDVEHFEAAAEAMHAHVTDPQQDEWQDVVHMGEDLVPGHPLFDHHVEAPALPGEDPLEGFDIDDYADAPTEGAAGMPPASTDGVHLADSPKPVGGYAFDFDLTTPPVLPPDLPATARGRDDVSLATSAPTAGPSTAAALDVDNTAASTWQFEQSDGTSAATAADDLGEFNDDPIDTKLDLARAYLDMGDADGARAMLGEVIKEGSQTQQDVARELLGKLSH